MRTTCAITVLLAIPACGKAGEKRAKPPADAAAVRVTNYVLEARGAKGDAELYRAFEGFVSHWPATRSQLAGMLAIVGRDAENRGGLAASIARLGEPLITPLLTLVAQAPGDMGKIEAAGAISYHLVARCSPTKFTDAQRVRFRRKLRPLFARFLVALGRKPLPAYPLVQGLAAAGETALAHFKPPLSAQTAARIGLMLYLILSNKRNEAMVGPTVRARWQRRAARLAPDMVRALAAGAGRGPSAGPLRLGVSVLGEAAVQAIAAEPLFRESSRCAVLGLVIRELTDQGVPLKPLEPRVAGCSRSPVRPPKKP